VNVSWTEPGAIDFTRASGADRREDFAAANSLSDGQGHERSSW
jgi:hypothetical protein